MTKKYKTTMAISKRNEIERERELEPIRESVVILVLKLTAALLLFEILYAAVFYSVNLGPSLPFDLHHHIAIVVFALEIIKLIFQVFLVLNVTLSWTNNAYYISGNNLIRKTRIIHTEEDIFNFEDVKSISVNQSVMGKILNFGEIKLKIKSEDDQEDIYMINIADPKKYERIIRTLF